MVDDGSTDDTARICDEYSEKFPFIHVTHTKNFGASHARNVALQQCRGEYIMFCDADDVASPQLIAVVDKAVNLYDKPDIIAYRLFMNTRGKTWPVYDLCDMKISDAEFSDGEELAFRVVSDWNVQGFTHNKAIKRELALKFTFDEDLLHAEDEYWFMQILTHNRNIRACYLKCYLYVYIKRKGIGLTRDPAKRYRQDGMPMFVVAQDKIFALENLPQKISDYMKTRLYFYAVRAIFEMRGHMSPEVYRRMKSYTKMYACKYYSVSKDSLIKKAIIFAAHVLITLHIYK